MATSNTSLNRQVLETRCRNARNNLLIVLVFTLINIILLVADGNTYFLFSAYVPYALVDIGMLVCGMYPAEYYSENALTTNFLSPAFFGLFIAIAVSILVFYLLSWIFSKNNKTGWLIFSLVLFATDTAGMFYFVGFSADSMVDMLFHAWVIISLARGILAALKLKSLPMEEVEITATVVDEGEEEEIEDSEIIRVADHKAKARILMQYNELGFDVQYRRVGRVNELVIEGNVYAEYTALIETAHTLSAYYEGYFVQVGYDGKFHSFIKIDDLVDIKKIRLH